MERAQGIRLVGRGGGKWTGHDVPDFKADKRPDYRPPEGATGAGGARRRRRRSSCRATARRGCSPRPGWPTGRCRPTTSRRSRPFAEPAATRSRPTRRGRRTRGWATGTTLGGHGGQRGVPVRVHDLPAHRAPHRRRDEPLRCRTSSELQPEFFCEISPGAGRRAGPRAPGLGDDRHRPHRDRGPGAGDRADDAAAVRRPAVHQVGLPYHWGRNGISHRRRRQRAALRSRSTPTCTSRRARRPPATSSPDGDRAGRRCWSTWPGTGAAPGVDVGTEPMVGAAPDVKRWSTPSALRLNRALAVNSCSRSAQCR